jgi:hypothetical protein
VTKAASAVWAAYDVPVAPYFVLVDGPSGQVRGEGAAISWAQAAHLWQQAAADGSAGGATNHRQR